VTSIDGTARQVTIRINGADEAVYVSEVNNGANDTAGVVMDNNSVNGNGLITVSWIAPVEREDGTPISMSEIAGYRVYYGKSQGDYTRQVDIKKSSVMSATLSNLVAGIYYLVVTTIDDAGRESAFSQEIIMTASN
jgi:fibronectin type 3 domain-containing protein